MLEGIKLKKALQAAGYTWAAKSLDHPADFGYHGNLDLFNTWGLCYGLEHRDSSILEQSNSAAIQAMIKEAELTEDFETCHFNHWAVGWIDELAIRLVTEDGINTRALVFFQNILDQLADYPILNEDDWSNREYEDTLDTLESCYKWDLESAGYVLPDDWSSTLYSELEVSSSDELTIGKVLEAAAELFTKELEE
jgi:hypothetical protein